MADSIFGISEQALQLCEDRAVMLSGNIVNSATPNYKARDIDFHGVLKDMSQQNGQMLINRPDHLQSAGSTGPYTAMYRVPMQTSEDGNTVDEEIERKNFLQNALNYQVNLTFVKNKSDQILKAIKGE